jgi:LmbE family N-acetylglucosaminyl deacetylase
MIGVELGGPAERPLSVLALGAHSDDIELGCGGTIASLLERRPVDVTWVVLGARGERGEEARRSAEALLAGAASRRVIVEQFEDTFFPARGEQLKRRFVELRAEVAPDVVLTHARDDLHQDHRLVCELTWNTFRDHLVLEYEIPKWDGDLGRPNIYVPLDERAVARKVRHLLEHFPSQAGKRWFTDDLFRALMRLRGMEANAPSGFAEAFHGRKVVLGNVP